MHDGNRTEKGYYLPKLNVAHHSKATASKASAAECRRRKQTNERTNTFHTLSDTIIIHADTQHTTVWQPEMIRISNFYSFK